jgi:polar amino acid transport system substrate-binding protein
MGSRDDVIMKSVLDVVMKTYVICLILFATAVTASADTIQLVTGNDYLPFTDQNLPGGGMITEIVDLAFKKVGYQAQIAFRPWKRGYEETKKGIFVATFPYIKTAERLRDFNYSQPINTVYTRVFVLNNSPFHELQDLTGRRICVPLGYGVSGSFGGMLKKGLFNAEANPVDLAGCLRMMLSGRKDFFIINEINGWTTIRETFNTTENFRTLDAVFNEETQHLIVSKTTADGERILKAFDRGLTQMKEDGTLQMIISRHLKDILE